MNKFTPRLLLASLAAGLLWCAPVRAETYSYRMYAEGAKSPNPANIVVSATALAFGTVATMQTKDLPLTLSNTGGVAGSLAFSTLAAPYSLVANNCPAMLNGGASCAVSVRFTPGGNGAAPAQSLAVTTDSTQFPIPLTGAGQVQSYSFNLSNNEVFSIPAGATGQVLAFSLTPSGNAITYTVYRDGVSIGTGGCGICGGQTGGWSEGNGLIAGRSYRFSLTTGGLNSLTISYTR